MTSVILKWHLSCLSGNCQLKLYDFVCRFTFSLRNSTWRSQMTAARTSSRYSSIGLISIFMIIKSSAGQLLRHNFPRVTECSFDFSPKQLVKSWSFVRISRLIGRWPKVSTWLLLITFCAYFKQKIYYSTQSIQWVQRISWPRVGSEPC